MKLTKLLLASLLFALPLASLAKADTAGVSFVSPGVPMNNTLGFSLGYSFVANAPLTVTALGYFDDGGLQETHDVGLYSSTGQLLASTTIDGSGLQLGFFNFVSIAPITLVAGDTYELMGNSGLVDGYSYDTVGFTVDPRITFLNNEFAHGNSLQFGTSTEDLDTSTGAFFGGNFLSTSAAVTPEPSSMLLLATGATAFAGMVKRRVRA